MLHELYSFKIFYYISLFIVYMCTYNSMCEGQKTTCRCQFPPSIIWELNSVNLMNPVRFRNFLGLVIYANYVNYFLCFMSSFPLSRKECFCGRNCCPMGMVHTCNLSSPRQEDHKFESNLKPSPNIFFYFFIGILCLIHWSHHTFLYSFCSVTLEMVALVLFFVSSIFCWLSQFGLLDLKSRVDYASLQAL